MEDELQLWRRASAALSLVQAVGLVAVFALVFFGGSESRAWAYAAAGVILVLEVAQAGIARQLRARLPQLDPDARYAAAPLDARQRQLVTLNLAATSTAPVVLALIVRSELSKVEVVLLLAAASLPTALALLRVRARNSWLAISRVPGRPRQTRR